MIGETPEEYLARQKAKGVLGRLKPHLFKGQPIRAGYCPCLECGHNGEAMIVCDPIYNDCQCCDEVCS